MRNAKGWLEWKWELGGWVEASDVCVLIDILSRYRGLSVEVVPT